MRLDLTELLAEVGRQSHYDLHEPALVDEDIECTLPIDGRLTFTNTGGTLLVRGLAKTQVALLCSRCGDHYFELPVPLQIDEQFELRRVSAGPRTLQQIAVVEEDESPVAGRLFDGAILDLTELLRQYILLELPTKPLPPAIQEERCAQCGRTPEETLQAVLGQVGEQVAINPAFAALERLLDKDGSP